MKSYWEVAKPLFDQIDYGNDGQVFLKSCASIPRSSVLLFSAHMALAEVHNGGFLQLFWNNTGVLVPEAIEGFLAIGMPKLASILSEASLPLGTPYPRNRDDRWDALLVASKRDCDELEQMFEQAENLYLGFVAATSALDFEKLDTIFWETADTENGGFQEAATRYAQEFSS
jgi:hypothetical protein